MRYSNEDIQEFDKQINELLQAKLIQPSISPHSSPAFMVRNHAEVKRGKARMVINYKKLNEATKFDGYYLPNKDILFKRIYGYKYYSKFDCKSGFWQIKLSKESIPLTAFSAPQSHYEWLVMPFGLKNAPQIFQRRIDNVFKPIKEFFGLKNAPQIFQRRMDNVFKPIKEFCIVYVDDILIFSKDLTTHKEHLKAFSSLCKEHGIILSEKKAEIGKTKIEFLGLIIDQGNIELQPHIALKIREFPDQLEDKKQLQRFLGCLNYAEQFIKDLAKIRQPFQIKLKKNYIWDWTTDDTLQVQQIKEQCKNLPLLQLPSDEDFLILETDASENYWSAILKRKKNHKEKLICEELNCKKEHIEDVCRYSSGTFKDAEKNYHINEKELLAVKRGIAKFEIFLLPTKFLVRTDNTQVRAFIKNNLDPTIANKRLIRWQVWFANFNFEVEYIAGRENSLADILTREAADGERDRPVGHGS